MSDKPRWIGVDFDETLRRADGTPVELMVERVRAWIAQGIEVRIVTARLTPAEYHTHSPDFAGDQHLFVSDWCDENIGVRLQVQWGKSPGMIELWDDKAVRVEANTGRRISPSSVEPGDRVDAPDCDCDQCFWDRGGM